MLAEDDGDRKSTRLNSSHQIISYAVFCLKKKKNTPSPFQAPSLNNPPNYQAGSWSISSCVKISFAQCPPLVPRAEPNFFFFNDTATTEIYTLSLHDALPI